MLQGIDISKWQNTSAVDLAQDFVIIKATEGVGYVDPTCDTKYQYAKSKGKLLGVYDFARPDLGGAIAEADFFVDNTTGYWQAKEAILVLDWEAGNLADVAWALTWLRRVRDRTGVKPLIYMSASTLKRADWSPVVNEDFGLWIAGYPNRYNVTNPPVPTEGEMPYDTSPWGFAALWQYTSSAGTLDRDVAYMSRAAWGRYAGGGTPPVQPPAPVITTKDEQTVDVLPFSVVRNAEADKPVGWEQQVQSGTEGSHTVVTRITYTDGNETGREVISDTTVQPVDEVIYFGTQEVPATVDPEPETPTEPEVPSPESPKPSEPSNDTLEALRAFILRQVTVILAKKDEIIAYLVRLIKSIWKAKK